MHTVRLWVLRLAIASVCAWVAPAAAVPQRGQEIPNFRATDVEGKEIDLYSLLDSEDEELGILFFFTTKTGEEYAVRLRDLQGKFPDSKLLIVAVGVKEDETALKQFAQRLKIKYLILPDEKGSADRTFGPFAALPVTFVVTPNRELLRAVGGSGEAEVGIVTYVAQTYLKQNKPQKAEAIASYAAQVEDARKARETLGFAQVKQGKLDAATQEFQQIDSKAGLAAVALEQGDYEKATAMADAAEGDGYAAAIKGEALLRTGKPEEAAQAFDAAAAQDMDDWKKNDALRGQGRALQEQGQPDAAISKYEQALELNPWDVTALSNESSAYQEKGDLQNAESALARAQGVAADDPLIGIMLNQIRSEMQKANDTQRRELIQKQIVDLGARYQELKAAGKAEPADDWSSRPLVVAFLPTEHKPVYFERVGTDVAIQRELETRLQEHPRIQVVEREVLDALLQELNIGSSDLTNPDTQLRLGKVLSAQLLGFADFAQNGPETTMYLRMVDTETTSIDTQVAKAVPDAAEMSSFVDDLVNDLTAKVLANRRLQGLVAEVVSSEEVWVNLGQSHGVEVGQQFTVLQDGGPIQVGGRTIGHRQEPVGTIQVLRVEDLASVCKVVKQKDGVQLQKEMRVKEAVPRSAPAA